MVAAASVTKSCSIQYSIRSPFRASVRAPLRSVAAASQSRATDQVSDVPTRRALLAGAAALVALVPAHSALAASRQQLFAAYYDNTEEILDATQRVLDIDPSDDGYTSKVEEFRNKANVWVADYRRTMSVGRKSFAETYAVINNLIGFYTGRGPEGGKLPAKVRDQAVKKLESARTNLAREKKKSAAPAPSARGSM